MNSKKYNRTFHLPYSKGATNDDKIAFNVNSLLNIDIVITEKMDGSNCSLEHDGCFARSHASTPTHASFDALKALHATLKYKLPNNMQFFGEWLFAVHSIKYESLPSYFLLFNIRDLNNNKWLSWADIELWASKLDLYTVPVLFKGAVSNDKELKQLVEDLMATPSQCGGIKEGVVVRSSESFDDINFSSHIMKYVRENHVTTTKHWKNQIIVPNKLK